MGFGWFGKTGDKGDKALAKARKFLAQDRWADALSFFEEALDGAPDHEEAIRGRRVCRENLVAFNLDEAEALRAVDSAKAGEHARLALDLAAGDPALTRRCEAFLTGLEEAAAPAAAPPPTPRRPLFAGSCSCAAPCAPQGEDDGDEGDIDVEDLAEFYLDSCDEETRDAFSPLGGAFRAGFVHLQRGEWNVARPLLEQAAREHPRQPGPPHALGLLASVEGRTEEAAGGFNDALSLNPDFGPSLRHLADLRREQRKPSEAVALLEAWLERHANDGEARLLLAASLLDTGDFLAAVEQARRAHETTSEADLRPRFLAARGFRLAGEGEQAASTLRDILARRPDALEALVELADLLLSRGKGEVEAAAELWKKCYRLDPDRGWWYLLKLAETYRVGGWESRADELVERAREERPDAPEAHEPWETAARP